MEDVRKETGKRSNECITVVQEEEEEARGRDWAKSVFGDNS